MTSANQETWKLYLKEDSFNLLLSLKFYFYFSRNNDSIFDELSCQDADIIGDVDFGADITGKIQVLILGFYRLTSCFVYDLYLQVF